LDVINLFIDGTTQERGTNNSLLLIGGAAICWSMWLTKIEVVFDKCQLKTFLHVLFRGTHWLRHWAQLQLCNYNKEHIHQYVGS